VREAIREVLPFHPTAAQKRRLARLWPTCASEPHAAANAKGMWARGKTIRSALQAMLVAMENGYQAALMAPTEILATQHFWPCAKLLERSSRATDCPADRLALVEDPQATDARRYHRGEAQLVIGTARAYRGKGGVRPAGLVVVD